MASESGIGARVVLQQCLSARLQVKPAAEDEKAKHVEIGRGLIVYVCFLKDSSSDVVEKIVKSVMTAQLSESEDGKLVSVLELPGDVLIIPQATLGGTLKGKRMQYHKNISKEKGSLLYADFVTQCKAVLQESGRAQEAGCVVHAGTYGNRQVFSCVTNGPYTHLLEF